MLEATLYFLLRVPESKYHAIEYVIAELRSRGYKIEWHPSGVFIVSYNGIPVSVVEFLTKVLDTVVRVFDEASISEHVVLAGLSATAGSRDYTQIFWDIVRERAWKLLD